MQLLKCSMGLIGYFGWKLGSCYIVALLMCSGWFLGSCYGVLGVFYGIWGGC